ncbi:hypothetical protein BDN71DRAFT_1435281 [Pleurotus eryngii]|uniref:Uncharacterized protein n=1 Tax=Pleurotus eryngii TaxID=5323 RepID=A0A9P5ZJW1_PLEER|nr:hypothetical protein BDN71DRAFT_1435281 [Pleurotus eryngii]
MKCKYDGGIQMLCLLFGEEHSQCMMLVKELLAWPVPVQSLEQFTQLCMEQVFNPLVTYHNNRLTVTPVDLEGINHEGCLGRGHELAHRHLSQAGSVIRIGLDQAPKTIHLYCAVNKYNIKCTRKLSIEQLAKYATENTDFVPIPLVTSVTLV